MDVLYPFRWGYRRLRSCWHILRDIWLHYPQWKKALFPLGRKVYVIGSPTHSNLGDSAIVKAQLCFLRRCGWEPKRIVEISYSHYENDGPFYDRWIPRKGLIAQLGGGHLGNIWLNEELFHRHLVSAFPENPTVIFPQTIDYSDDAAGYQEAERSKAIYNGRKDLVMVARERKSYEIMRKLYPDTKILLTPDIVLSASMEDFGVQPQNRNGALLCMRNDPERAVSDQVHTEIQKMLDQERLTYRYVDTHAPGDVTLEGRFEDVKNKMQELASARLVITDRLHGMVFCAITGTPCIAFGNSNHKVRGTYEWISYLPYIRYAEGVEDVRRYMPQLLQMEDCRFDPTPLEPYFEQLSEVVKQYV